MLDLNVREKKRKKIKKLVEAKMKSGKSENEAKKEVMKEQRLLSKEKKTQDLDKIKQKVEKDMGEQNFNHYNLQNNVYFNFCRGTGC